MKYWLSTLPQEMALERMVLEAKMRWRIKRDYQELKQELGLGHYEGRSWLLLALADDLTVKDVERSEQRGRAVALVVARHGGCTPFFIGRPGCVRSSACSGGAMYRPTMSSSFWTNFGSRETLKPRTR